MRRVSGAAGACVPSFGSLRLASSTGAGRGREADAPSRGTGERRVTDLQEKLKSFSGPMEQVLPCAFDKYVLLHRLATGGMGTVFVARTGGISGIQKLCVIKTLRSHFAADNDYVVRFMDEARIVVALDHRNICRVSDVGHADGRYFMAMELIRGTDLRAVWRRYAETGRPVPEPIALYLLSEALEALDYAHRLNDETTGLPLHLVHRDVSPQNIMAGYQGEVKVIDFGLAASTLKIEKTAPQVVMGKVGYMSPEQARGDPVDALTDQFAAGVVLYELLSGERYYEGMGPHQIWAVVGTGDYRPPRTGALQPDARAIVEKALHPHKSQRFASCSELRQALLDLSYQRGYRIGGPEVREAMQQLFAVEVAQQRELVASFAQMEDILPQSGPALAAAGREEQEATQTATGLGGSSGSSEPQDTGETRTEKVAPAQLQVFEDDDLEAAPSSGRPLALAAGLSLAAMLVVGVVLAVVAGDGPPELPVASVAPSPPPITAKPVDAPDPSPPATDDADDRPASALAGDGPDKASTSSDGEDGKAEAPASSDSSVNAATQKVTRKRRGTSRRRTRARQGRSGSRRATASKPTAPKPRTRPPPPYNKGIPIKRQYLYDHCPRLSCTSPIRKFEFGNPANGPEAVGKFLVRLDACLKRCAKQ